MTSESKPVRIKESDAQRIRDLKQVEEIREEAVRQGLISESDDSLSHEDIFKLVIPNGATPLAYPEDEMSWQSAGEVKDEIVRLAGENVAVHEVVTHFMDNFIQENNIQFND